MRALMALAMFFLVGCGSQDRRNSYEKNINFQRNGIGVMPTKYGAWGKANSESDKQLNLPNYGGLTGGR